MTTENMTDKTCPPDRKEKDSGSKATKTSPSDAKSESKIDDAPECAKYRSKWRRSSKKKSTRQTFPPEMLGFYSATQRGFQKQRHDTSRPDNLTAPNSKQRIDQGSVIEFPHLSDQTKRIAATSVAPTW
jgi:hypothetical protein